MATSRQFAQRARRIESVDAEDSRLSLPIESWHNSHVKIETIHSDNNVPPMPQRIRQDRDHMLMRQHLPIARKPLLPQFTDTVSFRHRLDPCYVSCSFCGADHWIEERV